MVHALEVREHLEEEQPERYLRANKAKDDGRGQQYYLWSNGEGEQMLAETQGLRGQKES